MSQDAQAAEQARPTQKELAAFVPRAILFDLDGTLIDTMGHFADLASALMEEHHGLGRAEARRRYLETSGVPLRQQLEIIFPKDPRNQAVSDIYEARKTSICLRADMPQDTVEALKALQRRGVRVILSSNSAQHFVDELVARCPVDFDLSLGFGDHLAKGEAHVAEVEERLHIPRTETLFVGDSLKDGELAARCDQRFVGVAGTFRAEDFRRHFGPKQPVIMQIAELPTLLFP